MTATQVPHRGQRFCHIFLVALGVVLLGLSEKSVVDWEHLRRWSRVPLAGSVGAFLKYHASILVPNAAMILMYLVLVIGRPRLSNQKLHSILRVAFALALIAGLVWSNTLQRPIAKKFRRRNIFKNYPNKTTGSHPTTRSSSTSSATKSSMERATVLLGARWKLREMSCT